MKKNRYILMVLALVVSIFSFEYYFLAPQSELLRESIETKYNALRRDEQSIQGASMTEDDMKSVINEMKDIEKKLIQEMTEFLASAKLQGEVSDITAKSGLKVMTIRPLGAVKTGNYRTVSVYFEGNGTIKQVSDFLKNLESGAIMMKIDKFTLNITNLQKPADLKFKIQVSGL